MVRQYIGARYVPKFYNNSDNTPEWRPGVAYEPLTIVIYNSNSYTSKTSVPASIGDPSSNPEFWASTGNYNAQVEAYRQEVEDLKETFIFGEDYVLTVGAVGCNYTNINDAVVEMTRRIDAGILPSDCKPTILITPGVYTESVNLLNCKGIHLVGLGSAEEVLIISTLVYPDSSIHVSGEAYISNVSMYCASSYAMHYEYQNGPTSGNVVFTNCRFTSTAYAAAGIGMGPNCALTFRNCEFISTGSPDAGVFFFHNYPYNANTMSLTLENCVIIDTNLNDPHTIRWDDVNRNAGSSVLDFRIINTMVTPPTFEVQKTDGTYSKYVEAGNNSILDTSYGNNIVALNSDENTIECDVVLNMLAYGSNKTYSTIAFIKARNYTYEVTEVYNASGADITSVANAEISATSNNALIVFTDDVSLVGSFARIHFKGKPSGVNL